MKGHLAEVRLMLMPSRSLWRSGDFVAVDSVSLHFSHLAFGQESLICLRAFPDELALVVKALIDLFTRVITELFRLADFPKVTFVEILPLFCRLSVVLAFQAGTGGLLRGLGRADGRRKQAEQNRTDCANSWTSDHS
jgi:hypothetical protein